VSQDQLTTVDIKALRQQIETAMREHKRKLNEWAASQPVYVLPALRGSCVHYGTYGEQGADSIPTVCGIECSTWDKPVGYAWEWAQVTCPACLAARTGTP
jgi:hypothetical protein